MRLGILVLLLLSLTGPHLPARADDVQTPRKISIFPESVSLTNARDRQGIIVQAEYRDGSTREVTAWSQSIIEPVVASVQDGIVAPRKDGEARIRIAFDGLQAEIPVTVSTMRIVEPVRFRNDVLPVFTKVGCNTGKCHGSASGKDGFRLSLFGYDPEGDHFRLTREAVGRRVNVSNPETCLLVNKATGHVVHNGGKRIEPESEDYHLLLTWLKAGCPNDSNDAPTPVGLEVSPARVVFASPEESHPMMVRATYSDGSDRDVTRFSVFLSNNDAAVVVDDQGVTTARGPGEAFILARFDTFTAGVPIIVRPGIPFRSPETPAFNEIDTLVHAKLDRLHMAPSEVCDDETFLRRAYIDVVGLLPSASERVAFLIDPSPDKRSSLMDRLIERDEFRDLWILKWAEMLQIRTANGLSAKGLQGYDAWLRSRLKANVTIDHIAREVLTATGGTFENPAVNYFQTETTPQLLAENVAQVFLGTRIQCAQCHNHSFDRWTMDNYYGFASFFSRIGYKQALDPRVVTVFNSDSSEMKHPIADRKVRPTYLGDRVPELQPGQDYRGVLADWLVSPENSAFARTIANVVWAQYFGQGIIEPDDDRVSNPPSNPELLDLIAKELVAARYDIRPLVRKILRSRTYQLTTRKNDSLRWDERNFSHQKIRRMRAEVLLDCISEVTATEDRLPGLRKGGRAVRMPDGRSPVYFLTTFGRANRATACSCDVKTTPTLAQALHLINGETTTGKIAEGRLVASLMAKTGDPMAVSEAIYVRCLGRKPTRMEAEKIAARLDESADKARALEDLFWALLNSNEFLFNH